MVVRMKRSRSTTSPRRNMTPVLRVEGHHCGLLVTGDLSPGLSQSQARPSPSQPLGPGPRFCEAQALSSQAKAGAFRPSPGQQITTPTPSPRRLLLFPLSPALSTPLPLFIVTSGKHSSESSSFLPLIALRLLPFYRIYQPSPHPSFPDCHRL
jgi:hypothetical protein